MTDFTNSTREGKLLGAAVLATLVIASLGVFVGGTGEVSAAKPDRPNIVVIMADDQFTTTLNAMPYTRSRDDWVRVRQHDRQHGALLPVPGDAADRPDLGPHRDREQLGDERCSRTSRRSPTGSSDAGYQTGFIGKYFNKFPWGEQEDYVPDGWDYWASYSGKQGYYDYTLNDNGQLVTRTG